MLPDDSDATAIRADDVLHIPRALGRGRSRPSFCWQLPVAQH